MCRQPDTVKAALKATTSFKEASTTFDAAAGTARQPGGRRRQDCALGEAHATQASIASGPSFSIHSGGQAGCREGDPSGEGSGTGGGEGSHKGSRAATRCCRQADAHAAGSKGGAARRERTQAPTPS